MRGAGGVVALVLLEWTAGWAAIAAWTQSWRVVSRGHFRISGWLVTILAVLSWVANADAVTALPDVGAQRAAVTAMLIASLAFGVAQYLRSEAVGVVAGAAAGAAGGVALLLTSPLVEGWSAPLAALTLLAGALLLGAVTNGMMLGHWYLNQPGLKTWALGRLTDLSVGAVALSAFAGLVAYGELTNASTEGAVLGIPGFGESFSYVFYIVWLSMLALTGAVAWGARRCVKIRSIQSATGLFYVAILSAGVAEFLVRYLTVNGG
jgi:hypothetical protein